MSKNYPTLLIGEIVEDCNGVKWKRTNIRDYDSAYDDNYYYMPLDCYCDVNVGGGYTFADEYGYGECAHCISSIQQINGHNDEIEADFDNENLFEINTKDK